MLEVLGKARPVIERQKILSSWLSATGRPLRPDARSSSTPTRFDAIPIRSLKPTLNIYIW